MDIFAQIEHQLPDLLMLLTCLSQGLRTCKLCIMGEIDWPLIREGYNIRPGALDELMIGYGGNGKTS
jgi:hypothetical protein